MLIDTPAPKVARSRKPVHAREHARRTARRRLSHAAWRHHATWPLTIAAALFVVVYAYQVIGNLHGDAWFAAEVVIWVLWVPFVVDYIMNLVLAHNRRRWFLMHFHEFLIVALPVLRPLRLLRLVTLLGILQRVTGTAIRGRVAVYAIGSSALLVGLASLAILDVEQDAPGATIVTYGDAIWWAFVTISTVGYGDMSPVTLPGRAIAIAMMIAGVALLGTVTAMLASWLLARVTEEDQRGHQETHSDLDALRAEMAELHALLLESRAPGAGNGVPAAHAPVAGIPPAREAS